MIPIILIGAAYLIGKTMEGDKKFAKGGSINKIDLDIPISPNTYSALLELNKKGYKSFIVGGAVRDAILGISPKDIDIEVYGIGYEELESILKNYGTLNIVGKSFGVIKFKDLENNDYDFSLPRKESRIGIGHKDFLVSFDKDMSPKEAAERRDFTFNSLAYDPVKKELHDYFGGASDLKKGIIKATSKKFDEDALRILRAMQFQSRFGMEIDKSTMELMREMVDKGELKSLPKERVSEEWMKWAIKGKYPNKIFDFIRNTGIELPHILNMKGVEQDTEWHPEGDAEVHTKHVLQEAVNIADREKLDDEERAVLIFSALCHDFAKADTTEKQMVKKTIDGKVVERETITSRGHEKAGGAYAERFLDSIGIKKAIKDKVIKLVENHLEHANISSIKEKSGKLSAVKKLAKRLFPANIKELLLLLEADASGRPPLPKGLPNSGKMLSELAKEANVEVEEQKPIIMGRHLIELGIKPSLNFKKILDMSTTAQEDGVFDNLSDGKNWVVKNFINK